MATTSHDGVHPATTEATGHETADADGVLFESESTDGADPGEGSAQRDASPSPSEEASGHVCPVGFCPIGMAVNSVGQVKPEAMGHLLVAGRELLLAAKAVVEARSDEVDEAVTRFQKIDIG